MTTRDIDLTRHVDFPFVVSFLTYVVEIRDRSNVLPVTNLFAGSQKSADDGADESTTTAEPFATLL